MEFWKALDSLLRGRATARDWKQLLLAWVVWQFIGAALFGIAVGVHALTRDGNEMRFMMANAIKLPMLIFFTSIITCPSLYVFGALRGLRFSAAEFAAMLIMAQTILAAVLGSLAPVVAFFAVTTRSYSFMVLLTVFCCGLGGLMGLRGFFSSIARAREELLREQRSQPPSMPGGDASPGDADDTGRDAALSRLADVASSTDRGMWQVLSWWLILYMFVGAQMGWILRPFVGDPRLDYAFIRSKSGSFIESVFQHILRVFQGN